MRYSSLPAAESAVRPGNAFREATMRGRRTDTLLLTSIGLLAALGASVAARQAAPARKRTPVPLGEVQPDFARCRLRIGRTELAPGGIRPGWYHEERADNLSLVLGKGNVTAFAGQP